MSARKRDMIEYFTESIAETGQTSDELFPAYAEATPILESCPFSTETVAKFPLGLFRDKSNGNQLSAEFIAFIRREQCCEKEALKWLDNHKISSGRNFVDAVLAPMFRFKTTLSREIECRVRHYLGLAQNAVQLDDES